MLYRITKAKAHTNHTVTITWSDGVEAVVDLAPVVAKGKVFMAMQDPDYLKRHMRVAEDRLGLERPDRVDFSADGLRFMAFPEEAAEEFNTSTAKPTPPVVPPHAA